MRRFAADAARLRKIAGRCGIGPVELVAAPASGTCRDQPSANDPASQEAGAPWLDNQGRSCPATNSLAARRATDDPLVLDTHRRVMPTTEIVHVYGLDIETDTSINGLDPRVARVTSIAIWSPDAQRCLVAQEERELLIAFGQLLLDCPPGIVVGWNSSCFDLPFLATRAERCGVELPIRLVADPGIQPKYGFTPPHDSGYRTEIAHHQHADIAYAYKAEARRLGVAWSLKPVAKALGIEVVEVDRERVHELSIAELNAYNLSDARATYLLAQRLDWQIAVWLDAPRLLELAEPDSEVLRSS